MPRTTIAQACRERGIDRKDWDEAKRQGIDPWDREAMGKWLGGRRHRIKPGTKLSAASGEPQTLDQIEDLLLRASSIDDIKILKEKLAAIKSVQQIRIESGELFSKGEARQSTTKVVSAARGELLKLTSDLPPQLEGLEAAAIQRVLRDAIISVLGRLADETSSLYAG